MLYQKQFIFRLQGLPQGVKDFSARYHVKSIK